MTLVPTIIPSLQATPQSDDGVTYAKKITPEEARIDWSRPASELSPHIRGLAPFPSPLLYAFTPKPWTQWLWPDPREKQPPRPRLARA